ncbi:MAG: hypothetical protein K9M08_09510 [Pirellula sp.]|nr:hypothetical protein [Pirellula sp.]
MLILRSSSYCVAVSFLLGSFGQSGANCIAGEVELISRIEASFSLIKSLKLETTEVNKRFADLSDPNSQSQLQSEGSTKIVWDSSQRFSYESTMRSIGNVYETRKVFDGKNYRSCYADGQKSFVLTSCLKPSWNIPTQAWDITAYPICFVLGFHQKDVLGKDKGLISLVQFMRRSGKLQAEGESTLVWTGDKYRIRIVTRPAAGFAISRIEYKLLKMPMNTEPRTVTEVSADFQFPENEGVNQFPSAMQLTRELSDGIEFDGERRPAARTVSDIKFTSVRINLDLMNSDYKFDFEVPDFTPVRMLDAEQLKFHWLRGEIVPSTDEEAARIALDSVQLTLGSKKSQAFSFWSIGIVVFCVMFGVFFVTRRR